jgi:hypothetical protein
MSYPQGPSTNPGYPPAQQPTTQFSAPTQQFGKVPDAGGGAADGPSKLPVYLSAVVAAFGLIVYLSSFGPLFTIAASDFPGLGDVSGGSFGLVLAVGASVLAALLAGVGLLPKQTVPVALVAVLSVLSFLLVIAEVINTPSGASIDWGLYLLIAFTLLQAIVAVALLLFDAGVITAPTPRPKYDQQQHYGQYGAPGSSYYGQQQHLGGPQQGQQQRPGYPSNYGGGYAGGSPGSGGYSGNPQGGTPVGPPTPPTGFPTYGQPPSNSGSATQAPAQGSSSSQSGPPPS